MEEVSLTETETRYYGDLFLCCDEEKTGKIPMLKATELFRSANMSNDKVQEIISIAGIPDTALHVSRVQFYSCLKLIAAHQACMPLRQELIAASVQLPLPRFSWTEKSNRPDVGCQQHIQHAIPPPPVTDRRNSLQRLSEWTEPNKSGSRRNSSTSHQCQPDVCHVNSDQTSTDSEVDQCESSCGGNEGCAGNKGHSKNQRRVCSPEAWSTNSDSPTPTNSVAERPWVKETFWQGLLGDEHRQLLGTEEESSDRHSSEDENETDLETVYQITPEQREYYFQQFKSIHHDTNGLLSGQVARVFFEKSRIPVEELRHIWQLCDVSRDGALSLAEFTAAMHLVVLRRNNIPLPASLPICLHPSVLQHTTLANHMPTQEPPEGDLLHLDDDEDEDNTDNTITGSNTGTGLGVSSGSSGLNDKNVMNISSLSASSQASVSSRQGINPGQGSGYHSQTPPTIPPPPNKNRSISNSPKADAPATSPPSLNLHNTKVVHGNAGNKDCDIWTSSDAQPTQWTKFNESPTSNVSSPGPKPVNFDMQRTAQAVVSDPQILHPVPLRVTPIAGAVASSLNAAAPNLNEKHMQESGDSVPVARDTSPKAVLFSASNATQHRDSLQNSDLRAIQRPQAKKLPPKNIGAIPPPPQREPSAANSFNHLPDNDSGGGAALGLPTSTSVSRKDPPPLPPPRPHRHGRSSSLDLNKFKIGTPGAQPEKVLAQASFDFQATTGFADFTQFSDDNHTTSVSTDPQQMHSLPPQALPNCPGSLPPATLAPQPRISLQSNQRVSAFEVYRKPNTPRNSQSPKPLSNANAGGTCAVAATPFGSASASAINCFPNSEMYEKRVNSISETLRHVSFKLENSGNSVTDVLRHLREQNSLLLRLCNDLSDELLSVQTRKEEMRILLETPTSSTSNDMMVMAATAVAPTLASVPSSAVRTGSSISAPVTANVTGGSGSSGVHSNI